MTRWQSVACLGGKARRVLASGGGRVLAASTKAIYLLSDGGQLIWLTTEGVPMHRRGARVAGRLPQTSVGSAYAASGTRLWSDGGLALDWAGAGSWQPPDPCRKNGTTSPTSVGICRCLLPYLMPSRRRGFGSAPSFHLALALEEPEPTGCPQAHRPWRWLSRPSGASPEPAGVVTFPICSDMPRL
jgi:hypothetical protein